MKHAFAIVLLLFSALTSCTSITVEPVGAALEVKHVYIQENPKVLVTDFVEVLQAGMTRHGISSTLYTSQAPADSEYVMTYTALRSWDGTTYLSKAEIILEREGQRVGYAEYHLIGKGGLSLMKWDSTKTKMDPVLDELFEEYPLAQP